MQAFQIGTQYSFRFAGDSAAVQVLRVVKRTAKFVTLQADGGKQVRAGVFQYDGTERCYPLGKYSMAPTLSADRIAA